VPTPDYVTTFEVWSNFPVEVGQIALGWEVLEVLPPISTAYGEPFPPGRWIGREHDHPNGLPADGAEPDRAAEYQRMRRARLGGATEEVVPDEQP
jgi:hypothetical protein